jgi:hypothetical protein
MLMPRKRKALVQKEFETFLHLFEKIMLKRNLRNVRAARKRRLHKTRFA